MYRFWRNYKLGITATAVCVTSVLAVVSDSLTPCEFQSPKFSEYTLGEFINKLKLSISPLVPAFCQKTNNRLKMGHQMPVYFISHGGPTSAVASDTKHYNFFEEWGNQVKQLNPKGMVIVSAHWELEKVGVRTTESNHLLYDFYGFPEDYYKLKYESKGSEKIANKIINLLNEADIKTITETKRGLDHGVWVPLCVGLKSPPFPIIQVSLVRTDTRSTAKSFEDNHKLGVALRPLRDEGILIVGSGSSTHNLPELSEYLRNGQTPDFTHEFEDNLEKIIAKPGGERVVSAIDGLSKLKSLPKAHPSLEHIVPFHVALGAAGDDRCQKIFDDKIGSIANSAFIWNSEI